MSNTETELFRSSNLELIVRFLPLQNQMQLAIPENQRRILKIMMRKKSRIILKRDLHPQM